jgi:O-antigen/teichoic acid export membrane protein
MRVKTIKEILLSNISFAILVLGSGSNFLVILVIKKFFPQADFNTYSLFLTFIGIVSSFGLIGFDQIFLRLSKVESKRIAINFDILFFLFLAAVSAPLLLSYYFYSKSTDLSLYQFLVTGIGINIIILTYNLFRLTKQFSKAQLFKNGFKIAVLFFTVVFVFIIKNEISINHIIDFMVIAVLLFALSGFWFLFKNIKIIHSRTSNLFNFFLSYCINLAIITALSFGERLIILENISENDFGKYFYYATIFLFPLTLVQQYVGFKELVGFKNFVDKSAVNKKIKSMILLGIILIALIVFITVIDNGFFLQVEVVADFWLITVLAILGLVKLVYGLFSALLGAVGNTKEIYLVNFFTIILILICLCYLFLINLTLISITISLILIFLLRSLYIYYSYVIKSK